MSHAPTVAASDTPSAQDGSAAPKTSPPMHMRGLSRRDQVRQGPHISAQAKPPPPLLSAPPLPLPLPVGEIPWPKMAAPRLEVLLAGRRETIPYWGFFVKRYLMMYCSHERMQAMQHIIVQRVALSMTQVDRIARALQAVAGDQATAAPGSLRKAPHARAVVLRAVQPTDSERSLP